MIGARWLLTKDGLGATNHFESCGFIRSRAGVKYPDIQYHFLPLAVAYDGSSLAESHGLRMRIPGLLPGRQCLLAALQSLRRAEFLGMRRVEAGNHGRQFLRQGFELAAIAL